MTRHFVSKDPKAQFILDCAAVAAGTMATLTGKTKYSEIDQLRAAWLRWLEAQEQPQVDFKSWQDAWGAWQAERAAVLVELAEFDEAWPDAAAESAVDAEREDSRINWDAYFQSQGE